MPQPPPPFFLPIPKGHGLPSFWTDGPRVDLVLATGPCSTATHRRNVTMNAAANLVIKNLLEGLTITEHQVCVCHGDECLVIAAGFCCCALTHFSLRVPVTRVRGGGSVAVTALLSDEKQPRWVAEGGAGGDQPGGCHRDVSHSNDPDDGGMHWSLLSPSRGFVAYLQARIHVLFLPLYFPAPPPLPPGACWRHPCLFCGGSSPAVVLCTAQHSERARAGRACLCEHSQD